MKTAKLEQLKADLAMFDQQNNIKSILGKNYGILYIYIYIL